MDLNTLSVRQLVDLGCALNGGTFGRDPARMNKLAIMAHVRDLAAADVVESVASNILAGVAVRSAPVGVVAVDAEPPALGEPFERPSYVSIDLDEDETAAVNAVRAARSRVVPSGGGSGCSPDDVRAIVREVVAADAATRRSVVAVPLDLSGVGGCPVVDTTTSHPLFPLALALAALPKGLRPNLLFVGPAGCGKSTLAHHIATALDRPFTAISLSPGVTEAALGARILPIHDGGRFGAVDSEFLRLYQTASVVLLDELDAADASVLVAANAAIGNGGFSVEARAVDGQPTWVTRSPENVILAAANTYGTGATALYVGRGALDAATTDRFLLLEMDYDTGLEARIMGLSHDAVAPWTPSASVDAVRADLPALASWVRELRGKVAACGLRRIVSTRMLQKACALRAVGCSVDECKERLLTGWTEDERAAVGYVRAAVTIDAVTAFDSPYDRGASFVAPSSALCPTCTSPMVERVAAKGKMAGHKFLGCSQYPKCRGIREVA